MFKDSLNIIEWIAGNISLSVGLSLMSQYIPCFLAPKAIQEKLSPKDYGDAVEHAQNLGFEILFTQPGLFESEKHLTPDFDRNSPFKWK